MSFLGRIFSSWYSERLALVVQFFFQIDVHTYKRDVGERRQLRIEIGPRELPKMKITHMCERREFAVSPFSPRSRKQFSRCGAGITEYLIQKLIYFLHNLYFILHYNVSFRLEKDSMIFRYGFSTSLGIFGIPTNRLNLGDISSRHWPSPYMLDRNQ